MKHTQPVTTHHHQYLAKYALNDTTLIGLFERLVGTVDTLRVVLPCMQKTGTMTDFVNIGKSTARIDVIRIGSKEYIVSFEINVKRGESPQPFQDYVQNVIQKHLVDARFTQVRKPIALRDDTSSDEYREVLA